MTAAATTLLVGTRKGLFLVSGDPGAGWRIDGPHCNAWPIHHAIRDPASGAILAGGGNAWFGPAVWRSPDEGRSWTHSSEGLAYAPGEPPVAAVWSLAAAHGAIWAGVEPAGLFRSTDGGITWSHVPGLRDHPSRPGWQPGGGGLILHHIVAHPEDPDRLWVGISSAGVFHSADGGQTWEPRNRGTRMDFLPEDQRYGEVGQCVHALALAAGTNPPGAERMYQQNHCGMYRSDDGGRSWASIEAGLPSSFGFPAVAHPQERETLWLFPLNGDIAGRYAPEARAAVWRTRDGGATWQDCRAGLPQEHAFLTVLRQAMAAGGSAPGAPCGVWFGTTSGRLYGSADEGASWTLIAGDLPAISAVEAGPAGG